MNNQTVIEGFTRAINKALVYVAENDAKIIAEHIIDYFPDTSMNDLVTIVSEYKDGDAWKSDITINEDEWKHIQDIIIAAGELETRVPYKDLIYTKYFDEYK